MSVLQSPRFELLYMSLVTAQVLWGTARVFAPPGSRRFAVDAWSAVGGVVVGAAGFILALRAAESMLHEPSWTPADRFVVFYAAAVGGWPGMALGALGAGALSAKRRAARARQAAMHS
jgi:hypothetical protein